MNWLRPRRASYLFSYWTSGFTAAAAIGNAVEGDWFGVVLLLPLAVVNYLLGRKRRLASVKEFDSFAEMRTYIDEREAAS